MTEVYQQKIVEAFRDNAIRSVLLIDDEYLSYKSAIDNKKEISAKIADLGSTYESQDIDLLQTKIQELVKLNIDIQRSDVASNFINFFHENKFICDVESNTNNLEHEKIRKSDLIVLDYYLEQEGQNRAEPSLKLINQLSSSQHMNVVVVYTNEPLTKVWLEIAATLKGSKERPEDNLSQFLKDNWEANEDEWLEKWATYQSIDMLSDFILDRHNSKEIMKDFKSLYSDDLDEQPTQQHINIMLENSLQGYNKIQTRYSERGIHGQKGMWLQAGDIFIALCSKQDQDSPLEVWSSIEKALLDWNPSVYRVVTSELQNKFEDANLTMSKNLSYADEAQMAFTWGILKTKPEQQGRVARELLGNVVEDALNTILYNTNFITNVVNTTHAINDTALEHVELTDNNTAEHISFQKKILELASMNAKGIEPKEDKELYEIAHAYNEQLSTSNHYHKYITTGSLLRDDSNNWYICVTPSCNTVPNQETDSGISDLKPHRALTLVKLIKVTDIKKALHNAHHSSYIFIRDREQKCLAFSVVDENKKLPDLIKVVIKNHDFEEWGVDDEKQRYKEMITFKTDGEHIVQNESKVYPIAMLKPAYAARYQNIQSHYEGRIGVDFAPLNITHKE